MASRAGHIITRADIKGEAVDYPLGWPVLPSVLVTRERLLPRGRGAVMIAVDDHVEPFAAHRQGTASPPFWRVCVGA